MKNWKKSMERTFELLLALGLFLIVLGFIQTQGYSSGEIIISGVITVIIGTWGILRKMKKQEKKKK